MLSESIRLKPKPACGVASLLREWVFLPG